MRVVAEVSLALCCGFLGMSVSAWNAERRDAEQRPVEISGFLPAAQWKEANALAQSRDVPILVYVGMTGPTIPSLHKGLGSNGVLGEALKRFVPVTAFLDGPAEDRALCARLGAAAAPDFLVVAAMPAERLSSGAVIAHLNTVTGSAFEPFGLTSELWALAEGAKRAQPLRTAQPDGRSESGINGLAERYSQLEAAIKAFELPSPADAETPLEAHLATEGNKGLRYLGWSLLASWLERCADGAAASKGEYLGVPSPRWETRLRDTTRNAWMSCPDDRLMPFGRLLIQRYARAPRDLDSLDRAFMGAVVRTLAKAPSADEFPGAEWLVEARAALPAK